MHLAEGRKKWNFLSCENTTRGPQKYNFWIKRNAEFSLEQSLGPRQHNASLGARKNTEYAGLTRQNPQNGDHSEPKQLDEARQHA